MKHQAYIYSELKEVAPFLAELEKVNVFQVPENYFSELSEAIHKKIVANNLMASAESIFSVPEGYFESLAGNILQKIKNQHIDDHIDELKQVAPLLYGAQKENILTLPPGYFETLPVTLLDAIKPGAKVVVMKKRNMFWNIAAAAIITGVMAISALWTTNDFLQQNTFTAANNAVALDIKDALQYKNEEQIDKGIAGLSDTDIVKYLENTGSNADDEALASDIQEKDLPDEQDYLNDENTLQLFLNNTDLKNNQN